jgi:hypothetical protein
MKTIFKLVALALIFLAPIVHLIVAFSTEEEMVVAQSLGIIPMILVMAIALLLVSYIYSNIKAKLNQHPFGFLSIMFYGGVGALFIAVLMFWFGSILGTAQTSFDTFKANFETYIRTMQFIIGYVMLGLVIATFGWYRYK